MQDAADEIKRDTQIRELGSYRSGYLNRNIQADVSSSTDGNTYEATIWVDLGPHRPPKWGGPGVVPYARRVEYGFRGPDSLGRVYKQAPQPYMVPPGYHSFDRIRRPLAKTLNTGAGIPGQGTAPQPKPQPVPIRSGRKFLRELWCDLHRARLQGGQAHRFRRSRCCGRSRSAPDRAARLPDIFTRPRPKIPKAPEYPKIRPPRPVKPKSSNLPARPRA